MQRRIKAILSLLIISTEIFSATYYSRNGGGNWTANATWSTVDCNGSAASATPTSTDTVIICAGDVVIMNGNTGDCYSLTIYGTARWTTTGLTTNVGLGGLILDGTGSITGTRTGILNVAGAFTVPSGANVDLNRVTINVTGTTTITGTITNTSTLGTKTFANVVVNTGGVWTAAVVNNTVTIDNVTTSGTFNCNSGTYTINNDFNVLAGTTDLEGSIGGTLGISAGAIMNISTGIFSVNGTTTIVGTLNITTTTGTKTFADIAVNTGGSWNATVAEAVTANNITTNGTFECLSGTYTVNNNFSVAGGTTNFEGTIGGALDVSSGATINFPTGNVAVTGTTTVTGTLNIATATGTKQFSDIIVNSGGIWNATVVETVTVTGNVTSNGSFDCSAGTYTVSGNVDVNAGTTNFQGSIGGTLTISSGAIMNLPTSNCTVTGATTISGSINFTTATGTKSFSDITINSGGSWNCTLAEAFAVSGNFQNDGTFTSNTGTYTFSGATKTFSGSSLTTFYNMTITGSYTNVNYLDITNNLGGAGTLTQGTNALLRMGDTTPGNIITATATGNKVYYYGSTNQTVLAITYYDVEIVSTGGIVNSTGTYTVNNNYTVTSGTVTFGNITVTGVFSIASGSIVNIGGVSPIINGNTIINGTVNFTNTTGIKTFNNIIINMGGVWNSAVAEGYTINGNIQNDGTLTSNTGAYVLAGASKTLSGTSATSIANITCDGSYTNNFNLTTSTSLLGAGSFTQGLNSTFNYGGTAANFSVTTFNASASGNTVNYNGAVAQNVRNPNDGSYHHISVSGSNIKSLTANTIINGNLTINSGPSLTVTGSNFNIDLKGNWSNSGTFTQGTATVTMSGTALQTISGSATTTYNNLTISNTVAPISVSASTNFNVNGNFTINENSTFAPDTGVIIGGTGTLTGSGIARVTRIAATPDFLSQYTISNKTLSGLTVDYIGAGDQTVSATNYGRLTISTNGTRTVTLASSGTIGVSVAFSPTTTNTTYVSTGSTVDFNGSVSETIPAFNYNNLTSSSTGARILASSGIVGVAGVFTIGTNTYTTTGSTVDFNGLSAQTIPLFSYYNLTTSGTGAKTLGGNIVVNNTLTITSNLDVTAFNYSINVKKDWINNGGTFTAQNGTVTFDGSVAQTIGGTFISYFNNITLNNSAGASLGRSQNLIGTLTLSSGTFTTTGHTFTLLSTASGTARIAAIPFGADIIGNITMQRYVSAGTSGWMLLSTPVSGATLQQWDDDFVTGGFPGSQSPSTTNPSIVTYDETLPGVYDDGYVTPSNITDPIVANKGYWAYVLTSAAVNIDVTGTTIKGTQTFPVTYTDDITQPASEDGWNLIANPYPSTIDWDDTANWVRTNVNDAVYVYDPTLDQYTSYVGGIGTNGGSNLIASSQGFLVQTNAPNPILQIKENAKASSDSPFIRSPRTITDDYIKLNLAGNNYKDETVIRFNINASNGFDDNYDAMKFFSFNSIVPGIATQMNGINFSVNSLPSLNNNMSIPVKVMVGVSGTYTIKLDSLSTLTNSCLILEDLVTGTKTDLRTTPSYSFYINKNTTAARFMIQIGGALQITTAAAKCSESKDGLATVKGVGIGPWDYIWKDATGTVIQTNNNKSGADTLLNVSGGTYTVEVHGNLGCSDIIVKTIDIYAPAVISTQGTVNNASCEAMDGSITLTSTSGGEAPYQYSWSNGSTVANNLNIGKGTYTLTITDNVQCQRSFTYSVNKNSTVVSGYNMSTDTVDLSVSGTVLFSDNSTGATTYEWNFGDGSPIDNSPNPSHTYLSTGVYTVILVVADGVCSDTTTKTIVVVPNKLVGIADHQKSSLDDQVNIVSGDDYIDLIFDLNDQANTIIDIYNNIGQQVVMSKNIVAHKNRVTLNFSDKAQGIYYIKIQAGDQVIIKKMAKS